MNPASSFLVAAACASLVACHDSPPPAQPASEPRESRINEVHRDVKENLHETGRKMQDTAESVQKDLHKGAQRVGEELGVRPEVVERPQRGDAGAR